MGNQPTRRADMFTELERDPRPEPPPASDTWAVATPERITRINPEPLHVPPGYHHVTVVGEGRTAYLAGQCPLDRSGAVVGRGDLMAQVDQVAANAAAVLSAVGASPEQVVRSVIYVVSDDSRVLAEVWQRFTGSVIGGAFTTASTLLGVSCLGFRGQRVELDLTAALPD